MKRLKKEKLFETIRDSPCNHKAGIACALNNENRIQCLAKNCAYMKEYNESKS